MKVFIDADEWYPVYSLEDSGVACDVPEKTVARWKRIETEFHKMQVEMRDARNGRGEIK